MNESRVPMPTRQHALVEDDVAARVSALPRVGRRFSMDVAKDALQQMGPMAIEFVTQKLAETVVHRHAADIERAVYSYINDRAWAEPVIRAAIDRAVRDFVPDLFSPEKTP